MDQAISKAFDFNEKYSDLECGKRVLLGIGDIHRFVTKDEDAAKKVYALFVEKYPDHPMSEFAKAMSGESPETTDSNTESKSNIAIYPNPFNLKTQIQYEVPGKSYVTLKIYNSLGQLIRNLVDETQNSGERVIYWDSKNYNGNDVASGVYFCRVKIGSKVQMLKLLLMK